MPRTKLDPKYKEKRAKQKTEDIYDKIRGDMERKKITIKSLAAILGKTPQGVGKNIDNQNFSMPELFLVMDYLGWDHEKIAWVIRP